MAAAHSISTREQPREAGVPQAPNLPRRFRLELFQQFGLPFLIAIPAVTLLAGLAGGDLWKVVAKMALFYGILIVGLRLLGKREFSQLSPVELVTLLMIPDLAGPAIIDANQSVPASVIALASLMTLTLIVSMARYLSKPVARALEGEPTILVDHGRFVQANLDRERIPAEEVFTEMRLSGVDRLEQVKWAILETDGKVSIVSFDHEARQTKDSELA